MSKYKEAIMQAPIHISIPFDSLLGAITNLTLEDKLQLRQILDQQIDESLQTTRAQELAGLREKIDIGTEQMHQGDTVDGEKVFQRLESRIKQMENI